MATKIPTNGPTDVFTLTAGDCSLEGLRAMIGGGYIEFFTFTDGSALMVDEEGKLKEQPINEAASALTVLKRRPEVIAGTAIFFSRDEMRKLDEWSV